MRRLITFGHLAGDTFSGEGLVSARKFNSIKELIDIDNHLSRLVHAPSKISVTLAARNKSRVKAALMFPS